MTLKTEENIIGTQNDDSPDEVLNEMHIYSNELIDPDDPVNVLPVYQLERREKIKRGPFQPKLKCYPKVQFGKSYRSFKKDWFQEFSWLEYSVKLNKAFCFTCRMFNHSSGINVGHSEEAYTKIGFGNWKAALEKFRAHQCSKVHLNSTTSLANFINSKPIDIVLDDNREIALSQKEQQKLKNREVLKRLIDVTLCLGIGGRPFRGHDERDNSYHKGLFKDIIALLTKYDPVLKTHMESGPRNATYCSNLIQNDLIQSISHVIRRQFKDKINNEKVSIIADETSDIGHHEQLSVVIRYFDKIINCPVEHFVCMKRVLSVDAQSIFNVLSDVIKEYDIKWENIISMCFDGAASMSGCTSGVLAKF
ncbi:zinc finger MYM-type protein 1-like [Sipha flava]|uniref:Zinc finger MYM-type protein 1-like n=1 Tax=Sipha flava TaxID=143950 RepID=A0A8B8F9W6_9HEMI|nr:zinc finger MYM-type protein 1-like [Sipha flava]